MTHEIHAVTGFEKGVILGSGLYYVLWRSPAGS